MIVVLIVILFVCLFLGIPIFMSLTLSSIITLISFTSIGPEIIAQRFFGGLDKFGLMAMPLFIFGANILLEGGIARRLLSWVKTIVTFLPGGTAFTAHFSCMFFGALCGSSQATVAAIGGIMYPELIKEKYDEKFSVGLISTSASIAILIPPSVTMVLYGVATGVSIGSLFIAGIGAGIAYTMVIGVYVYWWVRKHGMSQTSPFVLRQFFHATKDAIWGLGIPVVILGGIYFGIATPTEVASISTVYAILVSMFVIKEMPLKKLYKIAKDSAIMCAQVLILTSAAVTFGWILTIAQVPQNAANFIVDSGASKFVFLIFVNIMFLIAGCFMDGSSMVMILAPVVHLLGIQLGINPVHLGVIIVTNVCIGNITPPVGLNLFIASSVTGLPLNKIISSIIPFFFITIIALLLITYIPWISLFLLPAKMLVGGSF
ncbi:MAG: TRAP transporter large permease subunit [Bacteroidetes bacterium]|nr:TRAP transporter large permease subunit [Bacteroidota bacterium]